MQCTIIFSRDRLIVWEMSHDAADKVKEKQAGSGPMRASGRQIRGQNRLDN